MFDIALFDTLYLILDIVAILLLTNHDSEAHSYPSLCSISRENIGRRDLHFTHTPYQYRRFTCFSRHVRYKNTFVIRLAGIGEQQQNP